MPVGKSHSSAKNGKRKKGQTGLVLKSGGLDCMREGQREGVGEGGIVTSRMRYQGYLVSELCHKLSCDPMLLQQLIDAVGVIDYFYFFIHARVLVQNGVLGPVVNGCLPACE